MNRSVQFGDFFSAYQQDLTTCLSMNPPFHFDAFILAKCFPEAAAMTSGAMGGALAVHVPRATTSPCCGRWQR